MGDFQGTDLKTYITDDCSDEEVERVANKLFILHNALIKAEKDTSREIASLKEMFDTHIIETYSHLMREAATLCEGDARTEGAIQSMIEDINDDITSRIRGEFMRPDQDGAELENWLNEELTALEQSKGLSR